MDIKTCIDCGLPQTNKDEQCVTYRYIRKEPEHWQGKCNWCNLYKIGVCNSAPTLRKSEYDWQLIKKLREQHRDA